MIQIEQLTKTYDGEAGIHDLTLSVAPGQVFGLLGPNGAGKSTTIKCAVGLLAPQRGRVLLSGIDIARDPEAAKARLSYVPEGGNLYDGLTPREMLAFRGRLFRLDEATLQRRTEHLLASLDLGDWIDTPTAAFSKGMHQKTALALALVTDPAVLILDEPLTGLDVNATLLVKELLRGLARAGKTVLYSSHLLDVVEKVCDRVAVLARGRLVAEGTLDDLRAQTGQHVASGTEAGAGLDVVFRQLTQAADPVARARALIDGV